MDDQEEKPSWGLELSFWIDTDAYSERDRSMFIAGFEFASVASALKAKTPLSIPVHRENESRIRMAAAKYKVPCRITQHEGYEGCEEWSDLVLGTSAN